MLPRMGLRGRGKAARVMVTATIEDYDERKRNVAQQEFRLARVIWRLRQVQALLTPS